MFTTRFTKRIRIIPQKRTFYTTIHEGEKGYQYGFGKLKRTLTPGIYFRLPIYHTIRVIPDKEKKKQEIINRMYKAFINTPTEEIIKKIEEYSTKIIDVFTQVEKQCDEKRINIPITAETINTYGESFISGIKNYDLEQIDIDVLLNNINKFMKTPTEEIVNSIMIPLTKGNDIYKVLKNII